MRVQCFRPAEPSGTIRNWPQMQSRLMPPYPRSLPKIVVAVRASYQMLCTWMLLDHISILDAKPRRAASTRRLPGFSLSCMYISAAAFDASSLVLILISLSIRWTKNIFKAIHSCSNGWAYSQSKNNSSKANAAT